MSPRRIENNQNGFTLVEISIVIVLIGIITTTLWTAINTSFAQYLYLQESSSSFGELASNSQRIAGVVRGLTDVNSASAHDLDIYAYFYPNDTYVSKVHYYLSPGNDVLYADITPMTENPPTGVPVTSEIKTYTVISKYNFQASVNLFDYQDGSGNSLGLPITDLDTIKNIKINLSTAPTSGSPAIQNLSTVVNLRNRKTNL